MDNRDLSIYERYVGFEASEDGEESPQEVIPPGWRFYSADFSLNARDPEKDGRVTLVRDNDGLKKWMAQPEGCRETGPSPLYICGVGRTVDKAIRAASFAAGLSVDPAESS